MQGATPSSSSPLQGGVGAAPTHYVAGLGCGAHGFTTRSDIGPAQSGAEDSKSMSAAEHSPTDIQQHNSEIASLASQSQAISLGPAEGRCTAARISWGSEFDVWHGLSVTQPRRAAEALTITVVLYYVCEGGVPTDAAVAAAIDDLDALYKGCEAHGQLSETQFDFMKEKLSVDNMLDVGMKCGTHWSEQ